MVTWRLRKNNKWISPFPSWTKKIKRVQNGVAIILSPDLAKIYNEYGCLAPIIPTNENNIEFGRFIGIKLTIQSEF